MTIDIDIYICMYMRKTGKNLRVWKCIEIKTWGYYFDNFHTDEGLKTETFNISKYFY